MAAVPPPCDRFFNNLLCMKQPLLRALSHCKASSAIIDADLLEGAFAFLTFMNHQDLLDQFIARTHQHWELIAVSKDVAPILEATLGGFQELGKDRIDEILRIVKGEHVDLAIQNKLHELGKSLVKIAIRHLHATGNSPVVVSKMAALYNLDLTK